jgi:cyclophilin family peptidyl-prolyl cis-trans isomerase
METELGPIVIALYPDKAPITVANFLAYADKHLLDGGSFYRTVSPKNDNNPATISVIQGGLNRDDSPLPAIAHETTKATGLLHTDGVISMARGDPGTAGSEFFICLGDNPALDFGGARNKDGQGFAAFGRVVRGHGRGAQDPRRTDQERTPTSLSEGPDDRQTREDSEAKPELRQRSLRNIRTPGPFFHRAPQARCAKE